MEIMYTFCIHVLGVYNKSVNLVFFKYIYEMFLKNLNFVQNLKKQVDTADPAFPRPGLHTFFPFIFFTVSYFKLK